MISFRIWIGLLLAACVLPLTAEAQIEAVKGKQYRLSRQHGPWMIMVATMRDVDADRRTDDGLSAREAASQLIYELRKEGIPAYLYEQQEQVEEVDNGLSGRFRGHYVARQGYLTVLAGNFRSSKDPDARKVLAFIKDEKRFRPSFLKDPKSSGAWFARTPGRPNPLGRAMMTINPMLSPEEVRERESDPVLHALNSDMEHSLLKNPGKYSLVVATFKGNSVLQVAGRDDQEDAVNDFNDNFGTSLDKSAMEAWQLAQALRQASKFGYPRDLDAWVYHDRHKSVVTVGSFDGKDDPRLASVARMFRAKKSTDPRTGTSKDSPEMFTVPKDVAPGQLPDRLWVFDNVPRLMAVPSAR